ncbi:uncharacterized protein LOC143149444 [Ptiloglossa arizonensis]|uniref:uncharacterized protein LOC143149444 n=1 Tax=Ptiloglossa arizonensis TaxID=3350558 RepID=UPI003F9FCAC0
MRLPILLVALVSSTLAQQRSAERPARTPPAQIKYNDPNGLKVDWKLFAPQNQWRSHLENSQRTQRGQSDLVHPQTLQRQQQSQLLQAQPEYEQVQYKQYSQAQSLADGQQDPNQVQYRGYQQAQSPVETQQDLNQIQYKTYSQSQHSLEAQPDPTQIQYKTYQQPQSQLDTQPDLNQIPLYNTNYAVPQQHEQQQQGNTDFSNYEQLSNNYEQTEQQKSRREYSDGGLQGRIVYKSDYNQPEQTQTPQEYVSVPYERLPSPPSSKLFFNKNMPPEIQELLKYQAQLPYNVIANSIVPKSNTVFVPQLLQENSKSSRPTNKVYYLKNGRYEGEYETTKPVQEYQRH